MVPQVAKLRGTFKQTKNGYTISRGDTMFREQIEKFDNAIPDGVVAIPPDPGAPKVKIRALDKYCKENGVEPKDLTYDEMKQFLVFDHTEK